MAGINLLECLENSRCDAKEITTSEDFSSCFPAEVCGLRQLLSLSILSPAKISVHQARADEEDVRRESVFFLIAASYLELSRTH